MSLTYRFWADSGLTVPLTAGDFYNSTASGSRHDRVVYFGSDVDADPIQDAVNPGIDPISFEVADAAGGTPPAASAVTLALTYGELDTNTPGAPLDIGIEVLSGAANAVTVFMRFEGGISTPGDYTDLTLQTSPVI